MRAAARGAAQMGDIVIEDGRGAPDRRVDDRAGLTGHAGPFRFAPGLRQLGERLAVLAHAAGPVAFGVEGSSPHSDQLPS